MTTQTRIQIARALRLGFFLTAAMLAAACGGADCDEPAAFVNHCRARPDLDAWCAELGFAAGQDCTGTDELPMPTRAIEGDLFCRYAQPAVTP